MPLPTTGNLSLSQIVTEFGAPTQTPLSAFLRGGAWVPNTSANQGVPTAPPVAIRNFLGASKVINHSVTAPDIVKVAPIGVTAQGSSTATVSNGVGPFTHSWAFTVGGAGITLFGTTTDTVTASKTNTGSGVASGTLRDTVTDQGNNNFVSVFDISVQLENTA